MLLPTARAQHAQQTRLAQHALQESTLPAVVDSIEVGGGGWWDYITLDASTGHLFVAHGSRVDVVDPKTKRVVGGIAPTPGVHGIAINPATGIGYTSNGADASVTVFDVRSLKILNTIKGTGKNPDAILFDAAVSRAFTFNADGNSATAIDTKTGAIAGTVELGGAPENAVPDGTGKVFVNLEDKNEVVRFDARSLKAEKHWPLAPCATPTGMSMDRTGRRLFIGGRNGLLAVMDADAGAVLATFPIGKGVDGTAYDPVTHLVFASCSDGTLSVIRQIDKDHYAPLGSVRTAPGARTLVLDPESHRIYLPTAAMGPKGKRDGPLKIYVVRQQL